MQSIETLNFSIGGFSGDYERIIWQNDYLFAGKKLYESCISCEVIDDKNLYDISDHNPLIAEFKI